MRKVKTKVSECDLWISEENVNRNSGFVAFKRRIDEQIQLLDLDVCVDEDDLLPFYRMGESETFVLGALGCSVGM
ncbi:MAG: hypothetical protein MJY98_02605 [Fibrobacter sp.]|nr:hypothetical protein [Fibrobacter sp.]